MWLSNLRDRSLTVRVAVLMLAVAGSSLLAVPVAWCSRGRAGLAAAAVAGLVCLAGSGLALVATEPFRTTGRALHGMLVGMTLRMGVPLAGVLTVYACAADVAGAGFAWYLVLFFEVGLLVEVFLSLPPKAHGRRSNNSGGVSCSQDSAASLEG